MDFPPLRFNPAPHITRISLGGDALVLVVDEVLDQPQQLRTYACAHQDAFVNAPSNAFPGSQMDMPLHFAQQLDEFFRVHVRAALGGWRNLESLCRLSMVTLAEAQLQSRQWLCHRDRVDYDARLLGIGASVLYLFDDPGLGGTSFFRPRLSPAQIESLVADQSSLNGLSFVDKYQVRPGYQCDSNAYFERIATVDAKFNRMIFYDGAIFHSADIRHPERLHGDPARGRLTLNGFFTYRKRST